MKSISIALMILTLVTVCQSAINGREAGIRRRAEAMLLGSFVADAASMPMHWVYDTARLKRLSSSGIEFHDPPCDAFYKYPLGSYSLYGQQNMVYLGTIAQSGTIDPKELEKAYFDFYTTGACKTGCYMDGSTRRFVKNVKEGKHYPECGATDQQADAIVHAIPIVAFLAGRPELLPTLASVIRVTQNTEKAIAFGLAAARILEAVVVNGSTGFEAIQSAIDQMTSRTRVYPTAFDAQLAMGLQRMLRGLSKKNFDVVMDIGQSCDWPNNLWTGAHLIAQNVGYVNATRQTILAGGDSCSRNMFVQAFNAAFAGVESIPYDWKAKVKDYAITETLVKALVSKRP